MEMGCAGADGKSSVMAVAPGFRGRGELQKAGGYQQWHAHTASLAAVA